MKYKLWMIFVLGALGNAAAWDAEGDNL